MAEDTRKQKPPPSNSGSIPDSEAPWRERFENKIPKGQAGKLWEAFGNPDEPVNVLPGGQYNSAGGKPRDITWKDGLNWKWADFSKFYQRACARDALLVGIVGGAAVGGITGVIGGMAFVYVRNKFTAMLTTFKGLILAKRAANFGVVGFVALSTGQYMWCESRRREEARNMAMAVVGMKKLQEKKRREEEAEKAKQAAADAERKAEEERVTRQRSWKFW